MASERRNPLAQASHALNAADGTSGNSTRSYSANSEVSDDAHTLRQLSEVLWERETGTLPSAVENGGWDDMQLAALTRTADILVVAVGYPELVRYAIGHALKAVCLI
jgi:hypothetical protein